MNKPIVSAIFSTNENGEVIITGDNIDTENSGRIYEPVMLSWFQSLLIGVGLKERPQPKPLVGQYQISFKEPLENADYNVEIGE
jgi:hypothetical protein